jgi:TatD DNase family protein
MKFFDTHCHLAGEELLPHVETLVQNALDSQVIGLAVISADAKSLEATPAIVSKIKTLAPQMTVVGTAGLHPHEADQISDSQWSMLESYARSSAAAIGETGLDFFYDHSDRSTQSKFFDRHIQLACEIKKPLIIHCRNAAAEILARLDSQDIRNHPNPGVLHCFTEDLATARKLLDLGFYISFSGIVSFKNAAPLRDICRQIPSDRLLIETDSPWLAPVPKRGQRNEPAFVAHTFEVIAQTRTESREELLEILWNNSLTFFGIS